MIVNSRLSLIQQLIHGSLLSFLTLLSVSFGYAQEVAESGDSTIRGRVTAEDERGAYLGIIEGAVVEFYSLDGAPAAQAITSVNGIYEISGMESSAYTYAVSAPGYAPDDLGRGVIIPNASATFVLDFILTKGVREPVRRGTLSGQVLVEKGGEQTPLVGAQVSTIKTTGGNLLYETTDDDGRYTFTLPAGEWRVSALAFGTETQVAAGSTTVGGSNEAVVDFVYKKVDTAIDPPAKEVYSLISIPSTSVSEGGPLPISRFVNTVTAETIPAIVKAVTEVDYAKLGLTESIISGAFTWYFGETETPLPAGTYVAEAERDGLSLTSSDEKSVSSETTTYFDLSLDPPVTRRPGGTGVDDSLTDAIPVGDLITGVRGRISGQSELGEYLGIIPNATIELISADGKSAATAVTGTAGVFEFAELEAGNWIYRISAEGYPSEDSGRGFSLSAGSGIQVLDIILSRNEISTPEMGVIRGVVEGEKAGVKMPIPGATVTFKAESGMAMQMVMTDDEGQFEVDLPAVNWRVSALDNRFESQVYPTVVELAAGGEANLEFLFSSSESSEVPLVQDVFALVSVDREGRADQTDPVVEFISEDGVSRYPAKLEKISDSDLAGRGIKSGPGATRLWDWYEGEPAAPIPAGRYFAEARLADITPDISAVDTVAEGETTWFDLTLTPKLNHPGFDRPDIPIVDPKKYLTRVYGRVTGQSETGEYQGVIPNARIDLFTPSNALVASISTNSNGYYEFAGAEPGGYLYRVSGASYNSDDAGRGFIIPAGGGTYVQDFILSRRVEPPVPIEPLNPVPPELPVPGYGEIFGKVVETFEGETFPVENSTITLVNAVGQRQETFSDEDGNYSAVVSSLTSWQASASNPELENLTHPETIGVAAKSRNEINFTFTEAPMTDLSDAYVLVAVERKPGEEGPDPEVYFASEASGEGGAVEIPLVMEALGSDPSTSVFFLDMGLDEPDDMRGGFQYFLGRPVEGGVVPGSYRAASRLAGYVDVETDGRNVYPGLESIFDLRLERIRPRVLATVEDSRGNPIEGVEVSFVKPELNTALSEAAKETTDSDGVASMLLSDGLGEYNLFASKTGYQSEGRQLSATNNVNSITLQLFADSEDKTFDLTGIVVEDSEEMDDGVFVANAKIRITAQNGLATPVSLSEPLTSQADGEFTAAKVAAGTYLVEVAADGFHPYSAPLVVTYGMEEAIIELEPREMARDNWIRLMLTDGWGKLPVSETYHRNAIGEDATDCKVDYAMGLTSLRGKGWDRGITAYTAAASKVHPDRWWDRSCEGYIWTLMHREQGSLAVKEIRRLVETQYATRAASDAGEDTAYMFGVASGVLNGPWRTDANTQIAASLDRDMIARLQEPLRSSFIAGRDSVLKEFQDMTGKENQAIDKIRADATAEKARLDAIHNARVQAITLEMQNNTAQQNALTAAFKTYQQQVQVDSNGLNQQIQQVVAQIGQLQAQVNQLNQMSPHCEFCRAEGPQPGCQECLKVQRQIEGGGIAITRKSQPLQAQYQKLQALQTNLQNDYNRKDAQYRQQLATFATSVQTLTNEYNDIVRKVAAAPDPSKAIADMTRNNAGKKRAFITYQTYPIEERRQELLGWVTRKTELPTTPPALPSTPPVLPSTPPALPSTPSALPSTPPALPSTPPALPSTPPPLPSAPPSLPLQ